MTDEMAARVLRLVDQVNALADEIEKLGKDGELLLDEHVKDLRAIARKAGRA